MPHKNNAPLDAQRSSDILGQKSSLQAHVLRQAKPIPIPILSLSNSRDPSLPVPNIGARRPCLPAITLPQEKDTRSDTEVIFTSSAATRWLPISKTKFRWIAYIQIPSLVSAHEMRIGGRCRCFSLLGR